jgi:hypothetical protein
VHRAPAAHHQLRVYLGNGGQLRMDPRSRGVVGSMTPAGGRQFVSKFDPKAPQTFQDSAALGARSHSAALDQGSTCNNIPLLVYTTLPLIGIARPSLICRRNAAPGSGPVRGSGGKCCDIALVPGVPVGRQPCGRAPVDRPPRYGRCGGPCGRLRYRPATPSSGTRPTRPALPFSFS